MMTATHITKIPLNWKEMIKVFREFDCEMTIREIQSVHNWKYERLCSLANIMFEAGELKRRKPKHLANSVSAPWIYSLSDDHISLNDWQTCSKRPLCTGSIMNFKINVEDFFLAEIPVFGRKQSCRHLEYFVCKINRDGQLHDMNDQDIGADWEAVSRWKRIEI